MKKLACQILFVAINILFVTFNLSAQSPDTPVKFRLVRGFLIIVPVQIEDSEIVYKHSETNNSRHITVSKGVVCATDKLWRRNIGTLPSDENNCF